MELNIFVKLVNIVDKVIKYTTIIVLGGYPKIFITAAVKTIVIIVSIVLIARTFPTYLPASKLLRDTSLVVNMLRPKSARRQDIPVNAIAKLRIPNPSAPRYLAV